MGFHNKLIISAPFGNYLKFDQAISTIGTFTPEYRGGFWKRLWRVLYTVRYHSSLKGWTNKLSLPNPGIHDGLNNRLFTKEIISVTARTTHGWRYVLDCAGYVRPMAIELNVSCPNHCSDDYSNYVEVFQYAASIPGHSGKEIRIIVKLPPINYSTLLDMAVTAGISDFHCCNTLPTPAGGLSGKPLQPLSLRCCRDVKAVVGKVFNGFKFDSKDRPILIGGGGVTDPDDVKRFAAVGCTNVSVGSVCFLPWRWKQLQGIAHRINTCNMENF